MLDINLNYSLVLTDGNLKIDTSFINTEDIKRVILKNDDTTLIQIQILPKDIILYLEQQKDKIIVKSNKELIKKDEKVTINY